MNFQSVVRAKGMTSQMPMRKRIVPHAGLAFSLATIKKCGDVHYMAALRSLKLAITARDRFTIACIRVCFGSASCGATGRRRANLHTY
jgi:hypothetical protein